MDDQEVDETGTEADETEEAEIMAAPVQDDHDPDPADVTVSTDIDRLPHTDADPRLHTNENVDRDHDS